MTGTQGAEGEPTERRPTVLVVGDVMLDRYVGGSVTRVSPEAPVPVLLVDRESDGLGGAANVAHQVRALGAEAVLIGVVGTDGAGERIRVGCRGAGIDERGLVSTDDRPTTTKERVVVGRHQLVRLDRESTEPVPAPVEQEVVERIRSAPRADVIVASDYAKGVLTPTVLAELVELSRRWDVPLLADPKHEDFERYRGVHVLKANLSEYEAAIRRPAGDVVGSVGTDGAQLVERCGIGDLVVTLGSRGMVVLEHAGTVTNFPAAERDVYDVSGAGDTVIAAIAVALADGLGLREAAGIANTAAGLAVQQGGVSVVSRAELLAELQVTDPRSTRPHATDREALRSRVEHWRRAGRRVVFTNGCFDLFHAGHVHLLQSAAALGDKLVVAVDSDHSVRRLKGEQRPIIAEDQRVAILAALGCVDAVVLFESPELERLIEEIAPDILVKGADYAVDEVVGAKSVTAAGGDVVLVPLLDAVSTSAVVDRIRDA